MAKINLEAIFDLRQPEEPLSPQATEDLRQVVQAMVLTAGYRLGAECREAFFVVKGRDAVLHLWRDETPGEKYPAGLFVEIAARWPKLEQDPAIINFHTMPVPEDIDDEEAGTFACWHPAQVCALSELIRSAEPISSEKYAEFIHLREAG